MRVAIVIPTIRDLDFLNDWKSEFLDQKIIVCEDHPERTIKIPEEYLQEPGPSVEVYSHKEMKEELGDNAWIIPHKSAGIASFGFWKAWQYNPDFIYTIDDDCYPDQTDTLKKHEMMLNTKVALGWIRTSSDETRGFPYTIRGASQTVINHGMWSGLPDYDAQTHMQKPNSKYPVWDVNNVMPRGSYFPMCRMNLAFRPEVAVLMYSLLQGEGWPVNRFEDIWAGVIAKRVCDHLNLAVRSGLPSVEHRKGFDMAKQLQVAKIEAPGIEMNEYFWKVIDGMRLTADNPVDCYEEIINKCSLNGAYWDKVLEAMKIWVSLFRKEAK